MMERQYTIEEVANIIHKKPDTVRNYCKKGIIKAIKTGGGDWLISQSALDEYLTGKPSITTTTDTKEATVETSVSIVSPEVKAINERESKADAEAKATEAEERAIRAGIKLAETKGERDLPEAITQRDAISKQRESAVSQREIAVSQREQAISVKEANIISQVQGVENYVKLKTAEAKQIRAEADAYDIAKRTEADTYDKAKQTEVDEYVKGLDNTINEKQSHIVKLEAKEKEDNEKFEPIRVQVERYLSGYQGGVTKKATVHQKAIETSKGRNEDRQIYLANRGWDIEKKLKDFLKQIGL